MTTPTITDYLKYANLQMAAEAFIRDEKTGELARSGSLLIAALIRGNNHSSKFTKIQAEAFAEQWEVVDQRANTTTGFSGTLFRNKANPNEHVISLRSTEFIDDTVRDNLACNTYEIKNTGYAWGQISDMEAWYAELKKTGGPLDGKAFSVTGYSLGGHLATAFNMLHSDDVEQVVTFNGAGVGEVTDGTLGSALAEFNVLRNSPSQIEARFGDPDLAEQYRTIRRHLADGFWTIDQAKLALTNSYPPGQLSKQALDVWWALDEIDSLAKEAQRVAPFIAGGNGPDANTSPQPVADSLVEAQRLDYRMAVKFVSEHTRSAWLINGVTQAYGSKAPGGMQFANQYDIVGDTIPSAVAHSQWHLGKDVRIFIEDQPLYRGGIAGSVLKEMLQYGEIKLLVDQYALRDFGDTHSLVLLVDSLNVQNTLLQLMPESQRKDAAPMLNSLLRDASNLRMENGDFSGGLGQGKAEGDVLENVVNALGDMLVGPTWKRIKGSPDGNTWATIDHTGAYAGRATFYDKLSIIQKSPAYKALLGKMEIMPGAIDGDKAKKDFGAFLSLLYLAPFSLPLASTVPQELIDAQQDVYDEWHADSKLTPEERAQGKANWSDAYLDARAGFHRHVLYYNSKNARYDTSDGLVQVGDSDAAAFDDEDIIWTDRERDIKIQRGGIIVGARYVVFGSTAKETDIAGGSRNDRLFGGAGDDTLSGGDGADHLEGNADNDELKGGTGNDVLKGGEGADTYKFNAGDGWDVITDSDSQGAIDVGGIVLTGGKEKVAGSGIWYSADNKFQYALFTESDGSKTLNIINLAAPADRIFVKNFTDANLGITLQDGSPPVDTTTRTIVGDKDATTHDDYGNPNGAPTPGSGEALRGRGGNDKIIGLGGADNIRGEGGDDILQGGEGGDILVGGSGNDRLYSNVETDLIQAIKTGQTLDGSGSKGDWLNGGLGDDIVVAGADNDALFGGDGKDILVGGAGDDLLDGDDDYTAAFDDGLGRYDSRDFDWAIQKLPDFTFDWLMGPIYIETDPQGAADVLYGGAGNDRMLGMFGNDILFGEDGDDIMAGCHDDDILIGGAGDDNITGDWDVAAYPNMVEGKDYLDGGAGNDLLQGDGGEDRLFGGSGDDILWGDSQYSDVHEFDAADYLDGGEGNDRLTGSGGDDRLFGGAGNDFLWGDSVSTPEAKQGNDYLDGEEGDDILRGYGGNDDLFGGSGADQLFGDNGDDYLDGEEGDDILDGGDGDDILVGGGDADTLWGKDGMDVLDGGDGTDELYGEAGDDELAGGLGADLLDGGDGDDRLDGGKGSDTMLGGQGNDILIGGGEGVLGADNIMTGGDWLEGGEGNDTYYAGAGDLIVDDQGDNDLVLGGVGASGISMMETATGMHSLAVQTGAGESIFIKDGLTKRTITNYRFADGSKVDHAELVGNSLITAVNLTASGGVAFGGMQNDRLTAVAGIGAVMTGGRGDDILTGNTGDDILEGGEGADTLVGGGGNDTYRFKAGFGHDSVDNIDPNSASSIDRIVFGEGIAAQQITVGRAGSDMTLHVTKDDSIRLLGYFAGTERKIDHLVFSDGTVWDQATIEARMVISGATSGNDVINGFDGNDVIHGLDGNDTIYGNGGDDQLFGDKGDDNLQGGAGNDQLDGGIGADTLYGGTGSDTYFLARGSGRDVISEHEGKLSGDVDTLVMGADILPNDIEVMRSRNAGTGRPDDLLLIIKKNGSIGGYEDSITINNFFAYAGNAGKVEQIKFADGTVWNPGVIKGMVDKPATNGNDSLDGYFTNDVFDGLAGDDRLYGHDGNDTLSGGDGTDYLEGGNGDDLLSGGSGDDTIAGSHGNDLLRGDAGYDVLDGGPGDDVLDGGIDGARVWGSNGIDSLSGNAGNDTYFFGRGYGEDRLKETSVASGSVDTIRLHAGIQPADVKLYRNDSDLVLVLDDSSNQLWIKSYFQSAENGQAVDYRIEQIQFDDGTIWNRGTLEGKVIPEGVANAMVGTAGNDVFVVDHFSDTVTEGIGQGIDLVQSSVYHTLNANVENLTLTGSLNVSGVGNALDNLIRGNSGNNYLSGSDGNDTIYGGAGNDTLEGGKGRDTLYGGAGDDFYISDNTSGSDGGDVFVEASGEGIDTIISQSGETLPDNIENLIISSDAYYAINAIGNALDNELTGNGISNFIDGGVGADTMAGGNGNDVYVVDNIHDKVIETDAYGIDTVRSTVSHTLGANIERLVLMGSGQINGTGNDLDNTLTGHAYIDSGPTFESNIYTNNTGANVLAGGKGNDIYYLGTGDTAIENPHEGNDTVVIAGPFIGLASLKNGFANIENLTLANVIEVQGDLEGNDDANVLTGSDFKNRIEGGGGNDKLVGLGGDDWLDGGTGADTLSGGDGNDTYVVDNAADQVIESGIGWDTVRSSVSYTLGAQVESLVLTGNEAISGYGNAGENSLDGSLNSAANLLAGGDGNDTYILGDGDTIVETAGGGIDTVQSTISATLGSHVENLILTGPAATVGRGNAENNVITGSTGDNLLIGGEGSDTYVIAPNGGHDRIDNDAPDGNDASVVDAIHFLYGIDKTTIAVRRVADDLVFVTGADSSVTVLEYFSVGGARKIDQVQFSDGTVWNRAEIEQQVRVGGTAGNDMLQGTAGDDSFSGGAGNDTLYGMAGNDQLNGDEGDDVLDGGLGNDRLEGGAGNDIYVYKRGNGSDTVADFDETPGNVDTLRFDASVAPLDIRVTRDYWNVFLGINSTADRITLDNWYAGETNRIERIEFADGTVWSGADLMSKMVVPSGSASADELYGTEIDDSMQGLGGDDSLFGFGGNDSLNGGSGNDYLEGGVGSDTLVGGTGSDIYFFEKGDGHDTIDNASSDNASAIDVLELGYDIAPSSLVLNRIGDNLVIKVSVSDSITVQNYFVTVDDRKIDKISFYFDESSWSRTEIERRVVVVSSPTENADTLTGTAGDDTIRGLGGDDTISGGAGNDQLFGDTGNDTLNGNAGDDLLDGGTGADILRGNTGNDIYVVDSIGDTVTENANEGTDTVQSTISLTLSANVENLTLTGTAAVNGTGNALNNILIGNNAANTLNGGGGADKLTGGAGDDTYVVDNVGDSVSESAGQGTDTVQSSITYSLGADVENLTLTGTTAINGTGNALNNILIGNAAINTLTGGAGNDTLDGKGGADKMLGGTGDDTYVVDNASDAITENAAEGIDSVQSSVTYTLAANIEALMLTTTGAINGTGNALNNLLKGNDGNNTLNGGTGTDILQGGAGTDALTDTAGNSLLDGGAGADTLTGGTGRDFLIGGTGNDTINTNTGADVIAFNRGDGMDIVNASTGKDNTVSLGKGIKYADLLFKKNVNDLILVTGTSEQITFKDWYLTTNNRNVSKLQVVIEDTTDYNAASTSAINNKKVAQFNFDGLATKFDQARAANASLTSWALSSSLLSFHLGGSDTAAIGGDLAYQYAKNGNLSALSMTPAQALLDSTLFGTANQNLQAANALQDLSPRLM